MTSEKIILEENDRTGRVGLAMGKVFGLPRPDTLRCPDRECLREFYFYPDKNKQEDIFHHVSLCPRCSGFLIRIEETMKLCCIITIVLKIRSRGICLGGEMGTRSSQSVPEIVEKEILETTKEIAPLALWKDREEERKKYPENTLFVKPAVDSRPRGFWVGLTIYDTSGKDISEQFEIEEESVLGKLLEEKGEHLLWIRHRDRNFLYPLCLDMEVEEEEDW